MPRFIAPIQLGRSGGMGEARLPFHIVTPSDSIQTAITAAAADGKHIWMWPGTWTLFAPLTVPAGAAIYIWGCGYDTIIEMDMGGGGPTPMFQLAAGVAEFQLHDLTIQQNGWVTDIVDCAGACLHLYLDNVQMNPFAAGINGTNVIIQAAAGNITDCEIEHCRLQGVLDLRGARGQLHDSELSAVDQGHDFRNSAVIYAARNRYGGGIGGVGATMVIDGANAQYHDEGSHYTGDLAIAVNDGEVSVRGAHIGGGVNGALRVNGGVVTLESCYLGCGDMNYTISHNGGVLRMSDCTILHTNANIPIHTDAGAVRLGVHNCDISTVGGVNWGVWVEDGVVEITGNAFVDCGIRANTLATINGNTFAAANSVTAIEIRADNCVIDANNIAACVEGAGRAIMLYNDNCVIVGNQLQNFTIWENAGVVGNVIQGNRRGP